MRSLVVTACLLRGFAAETACGDSHLAAPGLDAGGSGDAPPGGRTLAPVTLAVPPVLAARELSLLGFDAAAVDGRVLVGFGSSSSVAGVLEWTP